MHCQRITLMNVREVNILLTKTTAARNGVAFSYRSVRGLYFLVVVFVATIDNANLYHQNLL